MVDFYSLIGTLKQAGFFEFVLPWLLFFAIILGLLQKTKVFGGERRIDSIISAVVAFFIMAYSPIGGKAAFFIQGFGSAALIISVLFVLVLFISVLGFEPEKLLTGTNKWQLILVTIILLGLTYGVYAQATGNPLALNLKLGMGEDTWTMILVLVFILLVVWFASKGKKELTPEERQQIAKEEIEKAKKAQG